MTPALDVITRASAKTLALMALAALAAGMAAAESPRLLCTAPVDGAVSRLASLPAHDWRPGHRGVDFAAFHGEDVVAPAAGTVTVAGVIVDRPVVAIRHSNGFVTALEPVDPAVAVGDRVERGQVLGTVAAGNGHCAPGSCVHWGLRLDGRYVDPLDYLEGFGPVRLLPLDT